MKAQVVDDVSAGAKFYVLMYAMPFVVDLAWIDMARMALLLWSKYFRCGHQAEDSVAGRDSAGVVETGRRVFGRRRARRWLRVRSEGVRLHLRRRRRRLRRFRERTDRDRRSLGTLASSESCLNWQLLDCIPEAFYLPQLTGIRYPVKHLHSVRQDLSILLRLKLKNHPKFKRRKQEWSML